MSRDIFRLATSGMSAAERQAWFRGSTEPRGTSAGMIEYLTARLPWLGAHGCAADDERAFRRTKAYEIPVIEGSG